MPRPKRIQEREQARAAAVTPQTEQPDEGVRRTLQVEPSPIDSQAETAAQSANAVQDDDWLQGLAKRAGWMPKEEWTRDPSKWTDARGYLENLPDELNAAKDRAKRTAQATEYIAEEARRRGMEEAQQRVIQAAEVGDKEAATRAVQDLAQQASGHPEKTRAWLAEHPWVRDDQQFLILADAETKRLAAQGLGIDQQLAAATELAKRMRPEHFAPVQRKAEETRSTPAAPAVAQGSRGSNGATPKERGWDQIPSTERNAMANGIEKIARRWGKDAEAMKTEAGRLYWANKAEALA